MIQAFQKFSQSRIAKVFLAIVALSFIAFFGGGNFFRPHDPNAVVAEVGNLAISRYELTEKVQQYAQRMAADSGKSPSREELLKADLPQMILWELIHELLLNLETKHLGLTVSDDILRDRIHSIKAFQNENGAFDKDHFVQILRSNGLSEDTFISEIRQGLVREQLSDAIMVGAYLPDAMIDPLFDAQYQHRQVAMLMVSIKDIPPPPPPSNEVLEAFYKEHQKEFETPELRTISLLILDPGVIGKEIPVTDEEIKETYEAKSEIFGKQKLEDIKALVVAEVQKEKSIEKIYKLTQEIDDKIAGGATFEELSPTIPGAQLIKLTDVNIHGQDRMETVSPQLPQDGEFTQEILKASFELEEGSDSPFTQANNGAYFTARVDKVSPPAFQPFAEIQGRVLKIWSENEKIKEAYAKADKYKQEFNQGNRKAALMTLLPNISLSEPSPTVPDGVKNLIYSLHLGQAGVAHTPEGFAVVVLNKVIPPDPKVREEKMAAFKEALLKHYQNDLLTSYVNALRVRYPVKVNSAALKSLYTQ
ncbi:MAG: SurA N-terminal domain-containing protein [Alphaproteobacteria bacterium]|nr:SurA N-terminal domain-containing protein [Alphaproteobacteria bacterium]